MILNAGSTESCSERYEAVVVPGGKIFRRPENIEEREAVADPRHCFQNSVYSTRLQVTSEWYHALLSGSLRSLRQQTTIASLLIFRFFNAILRDTDMRSRGRVVFGIVAGHVAEC
jgi:hypothetical protein